VLATLLLVSFDDKASSTLLVTVVDNGTGSEKGLITLPFILF
jgi:hypothetical protein